MTTQDARSLPADALEVIRRKAVTAVQSGASRSEVARMFGLSRKAVGAWVHAYQTSGDAALRPRTRGRRPGEQLALSPAQQAHTIKTVLAGTPDEFGLPFRLWTRQAIARSVFRDHGLVLSPGTIGQYLDRWALLDEPRVAEVGRRRGAGAAVSPCAGVEAVRLAWIRPHAPVRHGAGGANLLTGFRDYYGDVNVLTATSVRGHIFFQAGPGPFDRTQIAGFPPRLRAQLGRPVRLVVCRWPREHRELLKVWPRELASPE